MSFGCFTDPSQLAPLLVLRNMKYLTGEKRCNSWAYRVFFGVFFPEHYFLFAKERSEQF